MRKTSAFLILLSLLLMDASVFSQETTNSPYSKYGVGILRPETFSTNFAMGGTGVGIRSIKDIGFLNPASYSAISVTTFDVGFTNTALWLDDGKESQYRNNPYIDHIAFGVPIVKKKWGMSFGILPYSNTGYEYDTVLTDAYAGDKSAYSYGDGAINKVYWGNGFATKLDSSSNISYGFNGYFLFGAMTYDQKIIYGDLANAFNIWHLREVTVADFGADFGVQYKKTFELENKDGDKDKVHFVLGATYGLAADLDGKRTELLRTFTGNINFGTIKDTISFVDDVDHVTSLPSKFGVGISLEKENKWLIALDYRSADWGAIQSNDSLYSFKSSSSIHAGGEFIPNYNGRKYLARMAYRFGIRYSNSYIAINNNDWSEYGITFGVGLPIRRAEFSYPRLNIGFEYGSRGVLNDGLIKENFINFNVGITINSIWFQKRKID